MLLSPLDPTLVSDEVQAHQPIRYARYSDTAELVSLFTLTQGEANPFHDQLKAVMLEVINQFETQRTKTQGHLREVLPLAACDDPDVATALNNSILQPILKNPLLTENLCIAFAQMVAITPKSCLSDGNLVQMVVALGGKLSELHRSKKKSEVLNTLVSALGALIDVMVDRGIENLQERVGKTLSDTLKGLADGTHPTLSYQAHYALEGLKRVPKEIPGGKSMARLRKALLVVEIMGSVASLLTSYGTNLSAYEKIGQSLGALMRAASEQSREDSNILALMGDFKDQMGELVEDVQEAMLTSSELVSTVQDISGKLDELFPLKGKSSWYRSIRAAVDLMGLFGKSDAPSPEKLKSVLERLKAQALKQKHAYFSQGLIETQLGLLKSLPQDSVLTPVLLDHFKAFLLDPKPFGSDVHDAIYKNCVSTLITMVQTESEHLSDVVRRMLFQVEVGLEANAPQKKKRKTRAHPAGVLQELLIDQGVKGVNDLKVKAHTQPDDAQAQLSSSQATTLLEQARKKAFPLDYRIDAMFASAENLRAQGDAGKAEGVLYKDLSMYVPIQGKPEEKSDEEAFDVTSAVADFVKGDIVEKSPNAWQWDNGQTTLLMQGAAGAGKTLFLRYLEKMLWEGYAPGRAIPLFVSLPTLSNPTHDAIEQVLEGYGCSSDEISKFKQEKVFVLLLDGYDEIKTEKNLYQANQLDQWQAKVIITCRSEYLAGRSYQSWFEADSSVTQNTLKEVFLLPFGDEQIQAYITRLADQPDSEWQSAEECQQVLDTIPGLKSLVRTPFILSMIAEILPELDRARKERAGSVLQQSITRANVYTTFTERWFGREESKLRRNQAQLPEGYQFKASFRAYCRDLAYQFFFRNRTAVEELGVSYAVKRSQAGPWDRFFKTREEDARVYFAKQGAVLKKVGSQIGFIHKSVMEYFVADLLVSELEKIAQDDHVVEAALFWNQKLLNDEPSIINFIVDSIEAEQPLKEALYTLVDSTKGHPELGTSGANAATTLNYAREMIGDRDWRGVHLPGADLSCALLAHTNLSGANLEGAWLRQALLWEANLSGANLKEVQFGQRPTIRVNGEVRSIAFHPTEPWIAMAVNGNIEIINRATGDPVGAPDESCATSVSFSPDGKLLASGGMDQTCRLWDVATQEAYGQAMGHYGEVSSVSFSPDGKLLASVGGECRLWDVATQEAHGQAMVGHDCAISVSFSPDGKLLAVGSHDHTCRLWDVATQKAHGQVLGESNNRNGRLMFNAKGGSVSFSPDGKLLALGGAGTCRLWDVATQKAYGQAMAVHHLGEDDSMSAPVSVSFSPDGKLLASGGMRGTCQLWDVATQKAYGQAMVGHSKDEDVLSVSFSPDGNLLASGSSDKTCRLWDVAMQKAHGQTMVGHSKEVEVLSVSFSPDGKLLASGVTPGSGGYRGFGGECRLWDVATQKAHGQAMVGHDSYVCSVSFSPDGKLLASRSTGDTCRLWDVATQKVYGQAMVGHRGGVSSVSFSPDGKLLASGGDTCRLWDVATQKAHGQAMAGHNASVTNVSFSPDGKLLASGDLDGKCRLWDVATQKAYGQAMVGHDADVYRVSFSPDGKLLVSGGVNGTCRLWDVATQEAHGQAMVGHGARVYSVSFSPDGKLFASGSWDKTCRLWRVADQTCLQTIAWYARVHSVSFWAPRVEDRSIGWYDAQTGIRDFKLVMGDGNGQVSLWEIESGGQPDQATLRVRLVGLPSHRGMLLHAAGLKLQGAHMAPQVRRLLEEYGANKVSDVSGPEQAALQDEPAGFGFEEELNVIDFTAPNTAPAAQPQLTSDAMQVLMRSQQTLFSKVSAQMAESAQATERRVSGQMAQLETKLQDLDAKFDQIATQLASLNAAKGTAPQSVDAITEQDMGFGFGL